MLFMLGAIASFDDFVAARAIGGGTAATDPHRLAKVCFFTLTNAVQDALIGDRHGRAS